ESATTDEWLCGGGLAAPLLCGASMGNDPALGYLLSGRSRSTLKILSFGIAWEGVLAHAGQIGVGGSSRLTVKARTIFPLGRCYATAAAVRGRGMDESTLDAVLVAD